MFYDLPYSPAILDNLSLPVDHRYILDQGPLPYVLPPSSPLSLTRPEARQYVLEQAALILNQPVDALLDLGNQQYPYSSHPPQHLDQDTPHHFSKKPRLSSSTPMPTQPYSDGQEKSPVGPPVGQPDAGMSPGRESHGLFPGTSIGSGWTGARLADCFASFSMCPPFDSSSCRSLPASCRTAVSCSVDC